MALIYVIGSLENKRVPVIAAELRQFGYTVFDEWYSAGKDADKTWRAHQQAKGLTLRQALRGAAAQNVFAFDKKHLDAAQAVVLVMPAGRSGHLELGYSIGRDKPGFVLLDENEPDGKWDVMWNFATEVCESVQQLVEGLDFHVGTE